MKNKKMWLLLIIGYSLLFFVGCASIPEFIDDMPTELKSNASNTLILLGSYVTTFIVGLLINPKKKDKK